jgi:hypothetical protein
MQGNGKTLAAQTEGSSVIEIAARVLELDFMIINHSISILKI